MSWGEFFLLVVDNEERVLVFDVAGNSNVTFIRILG